MGKAGIVPEDLLDFIDLTVVFLIVFLLCLSSLEVLGPEFQIVHLVHGKQHKVQFILITVVKVLKQIGGDGLDAEFQSLADCDVFIGFSHTVNF